MARYQMDSVLAYGVYDVVSQQVLSRDSLYSGVSQEYPGSDPSHPSIYGAACYFGGQADPTKGDCAAETVNVYSRRICPCSQFGKAHIE